MKPQFLLTHLLAGSLIVCLLLLSSNSYAQLFDKCGRYLGEGEFIILSTENKVQFTLDSQTSEPIVLKFNKNVLMKTNLPNDQVFKVKGLFEISKLCDYQCSDISFFHIMTTFENGHVIAPFAITSGIIPLPVTETTCQI